MDMPDIDKIARRTARHAYEDGLGEIFYGVAFLLIGLLFFVDATLKPPIPSFSAVGLLVVVLGCYWLGRRLVPALRRRLVFPRTGFVARRQLSGKSRWMVVGVAAVGGCVVGGVASFVHAIHPAGRDWITLGNGLVVGAFLLVIGSGVGLRRFQVLAGFSGLAGLAPLVAGLREPLASAAYWAAMGLALMVSGAVTLRAYLQRAPQPEGQ
jgi:hypothetical protein